MRRNQKRRISPFQAGLISLLVIIVGVYFGFTKSVPFQHHFTIKAAFKTNNNLLIGSPVRIAGVNVGKVTDVGHVGHGQQGAVVTMEIQDSGQPIHKDATMKIRPRIFLEGNFFVDLQPGSPSAPKLGDGDMLPSAQTSTPVQLDQVLTALQSDTRLNLQKLLNEYSKGLMGGGAEGFNRSVPWWEPAYKYGAIVADANTGYQPHDLSNYVKHSGEVAQALDASPPALKSLITDFNTTFHAFAIQQANLERTVAELPRTLRAARPALNALNASFPPLRHLVKNALEPATKSSGPALDASIPFIRQARLFVRPSEARGLVHDLRPVVPSLTHLNLNSVPLYKQTRAASTCQNKVILPWSQQTIQDPNFPAKHPIYQESVQFTTGIAAESRSGDANGQWARTLVGQNVFAEKYGNTHIAGIAPGPLVGINPPPTAEPAITYNHRCQDQQQPDLHTIPAPPPQNMALKQSDPRVKKAYQRRDGLLLATFGEDLAKRGYATNAIKAADYAAPHIIAGGIDVNYLVKLGLMTAARRIYGDPATAKALREMGKSEGVAPAKLRANLRSAMKAKVPQNSNKVVNAGSGK